jgi:RNA polymerase sigma-70 factor (ECF subfamily)
VVVKAENGGEEPEKGEYDLGKLRSRDAGTFAAIVREYQDMVYNLALRMVRDRELAEDLSQEVFLKVHRGLPSFQGQSSLSTWIYRITCNVVVTEMQKARHRYETIALDEIESEIAYHKRGENPAAGPLEKMERAETAHLLEALLGRLEPRKRMVLTLYYQGGRTYAEIGEILGIPIGTVKTLLFRAKQELRILFEKEAER